MTDEKVNNEEKINDDKKMSEYENNEEKINDDKKMSEYEKQQMQKIIEWKNKEPSIVSKATGYIAKPLQKAVEIIVPPSAIEGALKLALETACELTDYKDILEEAKVHSIDDMRHIKLEECDKLAESVRRWAIGIAAAEGGISGAIGLPGIAVDIPALIILALRTIMKIGLCYGYVCSKNQEGREIVLQILKAAGSNDLREKVEALAVLRLIETTIAKETWKKIAEKAAQNSFQHTIIHTTRSIAKQLGINLTKRGAVKAMPVIGGVIGAGINANFINDVAEAAIRVFQSLWLKEHYPEWEK